MNPIAIEHSTLCMLILACLVVGATLGALIAACCAAASVPRCGCTASKEHSPIIEVEEAHVPASVITEPHVRMLVRFHTGHYFDLHLSETIAKGVESELNAALCDRELQRTDAAKLQKGA